jgi:hypothetical protein
MELLCEKTWLSTGPRAKNGFPKKQFVKSFLVFWRAQCSFNRTALAGFFASPLKQLSQARMLKEYLIGTEVYDRKPPYHSNMDSIVRSEARIAPTP